MALGKEAPSHGDERSKISLDTLLVEEIGQFGRYQWRMLGLTVVFVIFAAWAAVEFVFTTGRISTRCLIPECDVVGQIEFHPEWILNAVPESGSSFDNCRRFSPVNSTAFANTCPAHWFDRNTISECEDFVYQNTNTVVYDYGLACDEWRRSLIGSVRTFGTLTALPITGYISDRWGRRTALCINAFNTAWLGVTRYFADTYIGFLISEVVEATFGSGGFSCAYILLMEVVGPKYRVAAGATMNTMFSVGQITMGLLAWAVPNWRYLTLTLYIPQFITVFYYWLMFESIRWYISKGRYQEAGSTLKKVATINGKQLSDDSIETLRVCAEEEKKQKELDLASRSSEPWLIVILFRYKRVLLRVCVSPVWWITTTFIYYGLSINSVNMSGNQYVNYIAVAAVEIPGYWAAVILMSIIGRKLVLAGAFWLCCACQIAYIFMPQGMYAVSLTAYLIGKLAIATVMTTVYVYTTELYPTRYRHTLFAFSSMMGRIGSIIAPLTPAFGQALFEEFPFILFAAFSLISGGLVLLTPETMGTKLPDTMEEASNLGLKSSKLQPTL
ncbi:organic cation transporter protein-like [Leptidea sinapis]|uniref:organic cation transporter protein-like n=1 Tax=Leptidea sinapis TaxID=189913 RepID=UPI00213C44D4|nr:organic cation transporter protein-like [Leptidea sinapis]